MRVYQINGLDKAGTVVQYSIADNPASAVQRLGEARFLYLRAWISDESDNNVSVPDLLMLAREESDTQKTHPKGRDAFSIADC